MSRFGDYVIDMRTRRLLDREIEWLLTGAHVEDRGLALLSPVVEGLRSSAGHQPAEAQVRIIAAHAAAAVLERSQHQTDGAASLPRRQRVGLTPRLAAVTLAVLMVPATAGAALAADSAIPGDALYRLDRAFEAVGIGAGSTDERLAEAAQLAADGESKAALAHAVLALESDLQASSSLARPALLSVADQLTATAVDRSGVIALLTYISENLEEGVGVDGEEFGQGVAERAHDIGVDGSENRLDETPGSLPEESGSTPADPNGPPATTPAQGGGQPEDPGGTNGNGQNNGNAGSPNGNGDPGPPDDVANAPPRGGPSPEQPGQDESTADADPAAPESGGVDAADGTRGHGNGAKPDTPSVTAPGRRAKP
jgi:hypothetical protein